MWTQYDEDLSQNTFFKVIQGNHSDILEKSCEEKWIICVPRAGSYNAEDIPVKVILDHILVPQGAGSFLTMSKKHVDLQNHVLKYDDVFNIDVAVLFEETHYIEKENKYTVWCIERPLFVTQNFVENYNTNAILYTMQDCMDFLFTETFGHNILELIQNLCTDFWHSEQNVFLIDNLQSQKDCIGNLYSQCLQVCFKSDILSEKCNKNLSFMNNMQRAVETYMQYCLGQKLIYGINSLHHYSDSVLNKIIRNSLDTSLSDLNISNILKQELAVAKCEISRINNVFTILDKINCLMKTFNTFSKSEKLLRENVCLTSDDILQIFVYLILKSNISNWKANLSYIKQFSFSSLGSSDQPSFLVATLESSIAFIMSSNFQDIRNRIDIKPNSNTLFYSLYNKLKTFSSKENLISFVETDFKDTFQDFNLCHPLCSCIKCKSLSCTFSQTPFHLVNEYNQTLLILSCIENNLQVIEFLLDLDINVNFTDCHGKTALHYAAEKGFQDILMLLISAGVDVNVVDIDKNTPLHLASDRGHDSCVSGLIYSSSLVEINLQNISGETPLFLATKWGYLDIVKILLQSGASVCIENNRKMTVFKLSPNCHITELFKQYGTANSNGILREVQSCIDSPSESVPKPSYRLKDSTSHGIKPKNDEELKTVNLMFRAIENNDLPLTCYYLGYDVSVLGRKNLNIERKCHPLCNCETCLGSEITDSSDDENCNPKIKYKHYLTMTNSEGLTALHIAAKFGRTEILRILLDCGVSSNICATRSLYTPLHLACIFERIPTMKELLKCGDCNIDAEDDKGNTPLFYASIQNNHLKIVEILLLNGADCQKLTVSGKSIMMQCKEKNLFRVFRAMKESLGNI